MAAAGGGDKKKKEIYTYRAPWQVYSLAASNRTTPEHAFRFALGSFIEEYSNKIQIIQLDDERGEFVSRAVVDHPYPTTRLQWAPEPLCQTRDLLASSGDYLRLWAVQPDGDVRQECTFNNVRRRRPRGAARPGPALSWREPLNLAPTPPPACPPARRRRTRSTARR